MYKTNALLSWWRFWATWFCPPQSCSANQHLQWLNCLCRQPQTPARYKHVACHDANWSMTFPIPGQASSSHRAKHVNNESSALLQLVLRIPKASLWRQTCKKRPKVRGTVKLNQHRFNLKSCQCYSNILQNSYLERALRWALYRETKSSYAEHQKNGHSLAALQAINCEQLLVSNCHNKDASLDYCSWHHLYLWHCSSGWARINATSTMENRNHRLQETSRSFAIPSVVFVLYSYIGNLLSRSEN